MFDLNLEEYDESSDEILNELNRMKKTDTIAIKDIILNPLNPEIDTENDIKEFANKIYHSENGVIESVSVYRLDNGKYMLLSGHKRIKACRYNIEHENELDGTGTVQKVVFANILKKPENAKDEMNLILDFNDYRRLESFEAKYKLFLPYYQIVAIMIREKEFDGRIREYISKRSGLGLKVVGECIKKLKNDVLTQLLIFKKEVNRGNLQLSDRNSFLTEKTDLPLETIEVVLTKLTKDIKTIENDAEKKAEEEKIKRRYQYVTDELCRYLDTKCSISTNNKITINCGSLERLNEVLNKIGFHLK